MLMLVSKANTTDVGGSTTWRSYSPPGSTERGELRSDAVTRRVGVELDRLTGRVEQRDVDIDR